MSWPTEAIVTTAMDADADSPLAARPEIKKTADQVNQMRDNGEPALKGGSATQRFKIAQAVATDEAVRLDQGDARFTPIAHNTASTPHSGHANKATSITAGNGLTGGGDLSASRSLALGTPGQITDASTNAVQTTSHTHEIDHASTTQRGIVRLVDNLTSTAIDHALTAAQGKALNDAMVNAGENLGTGEGVFAGKSGKTLQFKSLKVANSTSSSSTYLAIVSDSTSITITLVIYSPGA